jgi:hypothetical protein
VKNKSPYYWGLLRFYLLGDLLSEKLSGNNKMVNKTGLGEAVIKTVSYLVMQNCIKIGWAKSVADVPL